MKPVLLSFFLMFLLMNCKPSPMAAGKYIRWIEDEDNGCCVSKKISDYEFRLQYKPVDYIIINEYKGVLPANEKFDKRKSDLSGMQYYTFEVKNDKENELMRAGISNETEYFERLEYLTSYMQDDISLVIDNDTLPCHLFHYERNYGVSPWNNFLLGFDNRTSEKSGTRKLIYNDKLLGTGPIMLTIKESDIQSAPQLKK